MRLEAAAAADSLACCFSSQNAIHNHIRLFEPLVIKALKQYTTTTSVQLQKQVLALLAQLVQLRSTTACWTQTRCGTRVLTCCTRSCCSEASWERR